MTIIRKKPLTTRRPAEDLSFAVGETALGLVLAAFSAKGIVYCQIGNGLEEMVADLQRTFPHAQVVWRDAAYKKDIARIVRLIDHPHDTYDATLDLRGSAFQKKVWKAVRAIPAGEVVSYGDIARKIGSPRAMRAVGSACAACIISFIIPCHRVLSKSGKSSGHWRISQHALIAREAKAPAPRPKVLTRKARAT